MRFRRKGSGQKAEMDMTPMIDMAFQLIAFFMSWLRSQARISFALTVVGFMVISAPHSSAAM